MKLFTVVEVEKSTLYNLDKAQIKPRHYVLEKFSVCITILVYPDEKNVVVVIS